VLQPQRADPGRQHQVDEHAGQQSAPDGRDNPTSRQARDADDEGAESGQQHGPATVIATRRLPGTGTPASTPVDHSRRR